MAISDADTFPELLACRAAEHPERLLFSFVRDDGSTLDLSYRRLYAAAIRVAVCVAARARRGERVLLLYPPGPDYVVAFFGCLAAGVIAVPCYPPTNRRNCARVAGILQDCAASLILTSVGASERLRGQIAFESWLELGVDETPFAQDSSVLDVAGCHLAPSQPQDVAFLQYTSGSTATPKGVRITHRNLIANSEQIQHAFQVTPESVGATWLPPYHDMGLIGGLLQMVYAGSRSFVLSPAHFLQQPMRWLRVISSGRATHAGAPNFAYELCASRITQAQKAELDLSSWSFAFCGAEPIRAQTLERFHEAFKSCGFRREALHPCYGLAEATLLVTASRSDTGPVLASSPEPAGAAARVSSGQPVLGQVVAIVDPDTCVRLPDGATGEIWVSGESIADGYWGASRDSATTAETFRAKIRGDADSPEFLRTGDLGVLQDGELYVAGRIKDLIILGGRNIYPQDVEAAASGSHRALRADGAAAFAVVDDTGVERLVVAQELDFRQPADDTLFGHIAAAVFDETGAQPDIILLLKAGGVPRTSSGKIRRSQTRIEFQSGQLQVVARRDRQVLDASTPMLENSSPPVLSGDVLLNGSDMSRGPVSAAAIEAWMGARLAEKLRLDARTIDPEQPFAYYGVDSRLAVELGSALSEWLQRPLAPTLLWDFPTPRQLACHLTEATRVAASLDPAATPGDSSALANEPIAIVGMGCRFPGADDPDSFWKLLSTATDAIRSAPAGRYAARTFNEDPGAPSYTRLAGFLDQVDTFDPHFFGISPREAMQIDPQQRLVLEVAWEALENAALASADLAGSATGVYIGLSSHDYDRLRGGGDLDLYSATGAALSIAPNRLSYLLDLRGPSVAVDTACSSSLVAVHLACQSLRSGETTLALAGGVNLLLSNRGSIPFATAGLLSEDGRCKAFDAGANGYVRGEGCGVVVLKRLRDARRDGDRIRAVIAGSAVNQDGRSNGLAAPNGTAQLAVIRQALAQAGISPAKIGYVEAHGTGTALGDPIELNALKAALLSQRPPDRECVIGSVKTNIGHLEAAAGIAGLIKTVLALEQESIPPNLHFSRLNPNCSLEGTPLSIPTAQRPWPRTTGAQGARYAGISSFGFGGTIAHVILAEAPEPVSRKAGSNRPCQLLTWSAKSHEALEHLTDRLARALAAPAEPCLADVAATLQLGRNAFNHRRMLVCSSLQPYAAADAARALIRRDRQRLHEAESTRRPRQVVFMFPGQGAQRVRMAQQLYCHIDDFRVQVDSCLGLLEPELQRELRAVLYPAPGSQSAAQSAEVLEQQLSRTVHAQPALFIIEYALARLWIDWGVQPQAMIGHSLGEYVAACVAGVFSIETALELVTLRASLMQSSPVGAMTSVALDPDSVAHYLGGGIELASVNAPGRCVLAGTVAAVETLEYRLRAQGVLCQRLRTSHAFHSASMEPILEPFAQAVAAAERHEPRIPYISNVTGTWITGAQAIDPAYWVRQLREPVRFADGLATLAAEPDRVLIEVGPGRTLASLARQNSVCAAMPVFPTLHQGGSPDADLETLLETVGRLWMSGQAVSWSTVHKSTGARRTELPTYPFERQRYWIDASENATPAPVPMDMSPTNTDSHTAGRRGRTLERLRGVVSGLLQISPDRLDPDAPLLELGADSLVLVQAIRTIESEFGVTLTIRQLFEELTTITAIGAYLDTRSPAAATTTAVSTAPPATVTAPATAMAQPPPRPFVRQPSVQPPVQRDPYGSLSARQRTYLDGFITRFVERTRGSKALTEKYRPVLADYRAQAGFRFSSNDPLRPVSLKELFYPLVAERSEGARLWDVDGREYVDLTMGFGAHLFGHNASFIQQAITEQVSRGIQLGPQSPLAGEVAELIRQLTGMERVAFCNSGTEAVMLAVRLARTATGRPKIAVFTGSYHGWADGQLIAASAEPGEPGAAVPLARGLQPGIEEQALVLDYGAESALQTIRAHASELAAVLVEPVQGRRPELQPRAFLHRLRSLTQELDIPLVFDEMITGFRLHPGGAQAWFDVRADIVTYGKAVGGGLPLGIVAGSPVYMNGCDGGPQRDAAIATTFFAGTFSKHPLAMATTRAVLQRLLQEGPTLQQHLNERTTRLVERINRLFADEQLAMQMVQCGSLMRLNTLSNLDLFCYHLVAHGVYVWEGRNMYLSTAHTDADLDWIVAAFEASIRDLREGGFIQSRTAVPTSRRAQRAPMQFSLSFFGTYEADYHEDKYRLLVDSARFADEHGFAAIWLPERHFHAFGGLSPNPVVLCAALARETSRIQLRAGSVVLPLHHPVRVAEDWSMVDNLSGGRVGIALASGWHPNDFVLAPGSFGTHRERMFEQLRVVQALWRGEAVHLPDGSGSEIPVRLFPMPRQAELPVWITIVNNQDTYRRAGELGAGVLTNLMGQTLEELERNIEHYREALESHGHDPGRGHVTVLLHTFLDEDADRARALAREPFIRYLRSSIGLFQNMVNSLGLKVDVASLSESDRDYLLGAAYERYVESNALIGNAASVHGVIERLQRIGVAEIGCFIDFGVQPESVLGGLRQLDGLRQMWQHTVDPQMPEPAAPVVSPAIPLASPQLRLWLVQHHLEGRQTAYNMPFALQLSGALNVVALRAAFQALVARHEILRTHFPVPLEGQEPVQVIAGASDAESRVDIPVIECGAADVERIAQEHAEHVFDLTRGPLLKVDLLRLSSSEHVLLLNLHEIICDGWSMSVLTRDIQQLYAAQLTGQAASLPELPVQYSSYARRQRQLDLSRHRDYWVAKLAGYESTLPLPYDHLAPASRAAPQAWRVGVLQQRFPAELATKVVQFSRTHHVTPYMTILSAALIVLHRYTGRTDLCVGTTVAGRELLPVEELVGYFVNIVPLRVDLAGDPTARELLERVKTTVLDGFEHQSMPFDQVLGALRLNRDDGHTPLVPVMVRYQNHREWDVDSWSGGLRAQRLPLNQGVAKCELDLEFFGKKAGELGVLVEYATELFERATVERILEQHLQVLEELVTAPQGRLSEIRLTSEERRLFEQSSARQFAPLPEQSIVELFEQQVALSPRAPACMTEQETLSFAALNARANRIAHALRERGVGPEVPVVLFMERSPDFVATLLGIFKAGGIYVPLDPHYPPDYLRRIVAQFPTCTLVSVRALQERLAELHPGEVLCVDTLSLEYPDRNLPSRSHPGQLACITYTSGSTGQPNGVMVPHRQILNWLHALWARMPFSSDDVVAQKSPAAFSVSLKELLAGLLAGAPQVLIPDSVVKDVPAFVATLQRWRVTRLNLVPSHLAAVLDYVEASSPASLRSLRHCITAGEPLSKVLAARAAALLPGTHLWNNLGCTELNDVTYCSVETQHLGHGTHVPLGEPIVGTRVYVLDERLRPVPTGIAGELCVASRGISRGYWRRPELTAERFVPDPYASAPAERLFRTGDLVRRREDGTLEYLGRRDFQAKIRGQRVDTLMVERELSGYPQIESGVVMGCAASDGDVQLVAYYTSISKTAVEVEPLRAYLAQRLPDFMVPTLYIPLSALPRLPNGKLNRRALPLPEAKLLAHQAYTAPTTRTEKELTSIWSELLAVSPERLGIHDNFFALGGHSLLAARMAARIRSVLSLKVNIAAIFRAATIARLAATLDQHQPDDEPILPPLVPAPRTGRLPLSFAQQRMWFLVRLEPTNTYFNMFQVVPFPKADSHVLARALDVLVARHEILRTSFPSDEEGVPHQRIEASSSLPLSLTDLSAVAQPEREARLQSCLSQEKARLFDVANGPLLRANLVKLSHDEYVLALTLHHLVFDGLSIDIFARELLACYEAFVRGEEPDLPPVPIQYADYALWQRACLQGAAFEQHLTYWRERLEGAPALLELPTDRPRPAIQTYRGAVHGIVLPGALARELSAFCLKNDSTVYVTLLSSLLVLLSRYSRQTDLVVGTMIADRSHAELVHAIGYFVNAVPLRVTLAPDQTSRTLLQQVKDAVLGAMSHQQMPFEHLVERLNPERSPAYSPIYQVAFISRDFQGDDVTQAEVLESSGDEPATGTTVHDLLVTARQLKSGIALHFNYNTDLFDAGTVERWARHYCRLVESIIGSPDARLADLPLLSEAEHRQLLLEWNETQVGDPAQGTLAECLEAQVARTPAEVAVVYEGASLTYAELNVRANRLAHYLRGAGIGPDMPVAICVERSLEMIVGLIAIAKAGGAHVPLDPAYPPERLAYMLTDARPVILLTQQHLVASLPAHDIPMFLLDAQAASLTHYPEDNPRAGVSPQNLAYVIYTSGSTGRPKGTLVHQCGFLNLLRWFSAHFQMRSTDRVMLFSSLSFDLTQKNIFVPLLTGGQLHLPPQGYAPEAARAYIHTHGITLLNCAPSAFYPLLAGLTSRPTRGADEWHELASLRHIFLGGEPIQARLLHEAFSGARSRPMVHNTYGPTEASDVVSWFSWDPGDARDSLPIGRPIANTQLYILDDQLHPVPIGVKGQLHVAGAGVGRGYLHRPDLTAERFIPNPFGPPGSRLYQTGDLARYLPDGNIEYLGRLDHQVKIRGLRVEPGEIEAALTDVPSVREAAVVLDKGSSGDSRLVAYLVRRDAGDADLDPRTLRNTLLRSLPEHMVPSHFIVLDRLPLTPNGKLDRKALPTPGEGTLAQQTYTAPVTATERALVAIWSEVLRLPAERIGVHDSFFALGGHSLLALQLQHSIAARLRRSLPLATFFKSPTVLEMATAIDAQSAAGSLLVWLEENADGLPLFCIHPAGGEVVCYRALARELGRHLPVYAIQSPEAAGLSVTFESLAEMADAYAAAILEAQPEGPYRLLGWSSGGLIAIAVAAALQRRGKPPGYVGLLDSHPLHQLLGEPTPSRLSAAALLTVLAAFRPNILTSDTLAQLDLAAWDESTSELFSSAPPDLLRSRLQELTGAALSVAELESLRIQVVTTRRHLALLLTDVPDVVVAILQVVVAKDAAGLPGELLSHEPTWPGQAEQVGGNHYSMLSEPHVHALADLILQKCASAGESPERVLAVHGLNGSDPLPGNRGGDEPATCLFLHGLGDNSAVWEPVAKSLSGHYRALGLDFRGHGDSFWDRGGRYGVADHVEDVMAAVERLQLGRFALVGHSLGGQVALQIASAYPERVTHLALVDFGPERDRESCDAIVASVKDGIRRYNSVEDYIVHILQHRPITSPMLVRHMALSALRAAADGTFLPKTDPAVVSIDLQATSNEELWAMLKAVRCPTLVVRGYGSAVLRDTVARRMADTLSDGRYHVVPAAGHSVMTDNPQDCSATIFSFLCDSREHTLHPGFGAVGSSTRR